MKAAPSYAAASTILLFACYAILIQQLSSALPLCTDLRAPTSTKGTLFFCPRNGTTCCDSNQDVQLHKQFQSMNISDTDCAAIIKSVICATCDPYSAELYKVESGQKRSLPVLCNTTSTNSSSSGSYSSKQATTVSFCSTIWNTCKDVPIKNSPFEPSLQGRASTTPSQDTNTSTTLINLWQSETEFCNTFGAPTTNTSVCYTGEPVSLENVTETTVQPRGVCLEKINNGSYINMDAHPDGSNRAFFSNLPGKIWLASIPEQGKGDILELDESDPFVDLTDQVLFDTMFGMLGIAFHPDFANNGRFFASYNCDRQKSPGCNGRCACNSDVDCDPSKLNTNDSSQPCQYQSVIGEFSANGTESNPSTAENAKPIEVRRIFTMGLPHTNDHGGQILFGPEDKYLYVMMGDGGGRGDPYNFAQNKKSLLGKVMRLDVDHMPSQEEIAKQGRWGNYSIPPDNPVREDKDMEPEIWAMGLRNPWRCSFDAERPSYFVCGDVGQDRYEEVDLVTKGGNYGWREYEGPLLTSSHQSLASSNSSNSQDLIFPVSGYNHSSVNDKIGSAAISGGLFYRSQTDPCLYGSYLYGDLYASNMWMATETPKDSGNFTTTGITFSCAQDSPIKCSLVPESTMPALGYIYSFGQDNRKDTFILASSGVYRVVRPSRCKYACSKEVVVPAGGPSPSPSSSTSGVAQLVLTRRGGEWLLCILVLLFQVVVVPAGGPGPSPSSSTSGVAQLVLTRRGGEWLLCILVLLFQVVVV